MRVNSSLSQYSSTNNCASFAIEIICVKNVFRRIPCSPHGHLCLNSSGVCQSIKCPEYWLNKSRSGPHVYSERWLEKNRDTVWQRENGVWLSCQLQSLHQQRYWRSTTWLSNSWTWFHPAENERKKEQTMNVSIKKNKKSHRLSSYHIHSTWDLRCCCCVLTSIRRHPLFE